MADDIMTADEILAYDDIPRELVAVPEWKGRKVWVHGLDGTGRDAFESEVSGGGAKGAVRNLANFRARLLVRCLRDAKGEQLFSPEQMAALGRKSGRALDRLADVALRLSGMDAKALEEAEGNSGGGPS